MVCYVIPLFSAIMLFLLRKTSHKTSNSLRWLNLLFTGGAVMLVIDHLWNGELFLIGENIVWDLALGITMTLGVIVFWGIVLIASKVSVTALMESQT